MKNNKNDEYNAIRLRTTSTNVDSWSTVADKYLDLYQKTIGKNNL